MTDLRTIIAHCLRMGMNLYDTPEAFADAILKRLDHEGFAAIQKDRLTDPADAKAELLIDNLRIRLCEDPDEIAIDRDGEGGHFSMLEFAETVHQFVSDRL